MLEVLIVTLGEVLEDTAVAGVGEVEEVRMFVKFEGGVIAGEGDVGNPPPDAVLGVNEEVVEAGMLDPNPVGQSQAVTVIVETETTVTVATLGVLAGGEDGTEVRGVGVVGVVELAGVEED